MKRLELTPRIAEYLRRSGVENADPQAIAVFEATAVNTMPLRKQHPLFNGARMDASVLYQMAAELIQESRPVQVQHDSTLTPVGRVFHGEVMPMPGNAQEYELRTLFFIDSTEADTVKKIESGTIDQVSVSVLNKQALNSVSGFDYFGEDSTFENIFSGDDGDGNILGKDGVYARLMGLDAFFEMSLVGQGGAQRARIVSRDQSHFGSSYQKLAASGVDPNAFILAASIEEPKMDLTELVEKLTEKEVALSKATDQVTALTADKTDLEAKVAKLETKVTELTEKADEVDSEAFTAAQAELSSATESLKSVAKVLLTANGKGEEALPETAAELSMLIEEQKTSLAAVLVAGGKSRAADNDDVTGVVGLTSVSSYRLNRR